MEKPELEPEEIEKERLPAYSEDGVDLTLIRWMLSLTPSERLNTLQEFVNTFARINIVSTHR